MIPSTSGTVPNGSERFRTVPEIRVSEDLALTNKYLLGHFVGQEFVGNTRKWNYEIGAYVMICRLLNAAGAHWPMVFTVKIKHQNSQPVTLSWILQGI